MDHGALVVGQDRQPPVVGVVVVVQVRAAQRDLAQLPADKAPANVYYELFSPNDWLVA